MKRIFLLLLCASLFCLPDRCFAQSDYTKDYKLLESSGKLPPILTTSATEKANSDINSIKKEKNSRAKKAKEDFYVLSNFKMDRLLRSGKILFNDSVTNFVNKVADETFKSVPEIRKGLHIYILKSDIVNAFTADNGIVIVSMGLIAQLDNEAQLSFILAHEASHFIKKHSVDSYVTRNAGGNSYRRENLDEYKYSKDAEFEADKEGLKIFKKTKYSYKGISGAFNMLKYADLPFDEIKFDKDFLEDKDLVFPSDYFLTELNPINADEDYDDSKSTHPNIRKRKDNISLELGEFSDDGRTKFLVDQAQFFRVREMARFELCNIHLLQEDYAMAVYESYVLLKKYPQNVYLKKTIGKALFNIAAAKAPLERNYKDCLQPSLDIAGARTISYPYYNVEGNSQQVYHLMNKLSATESNILALDYNWKLKKELNNDPQISELCDSLFILLALNNKTGSTYFNSESRTEVLAELNKENNVSSSDQQETTTNAADTTLKKKLTSLDQLEDDDADSKITRINQQNKKVEVVEDRVVLTDSAKKAEINEKLDAEFDKYAFYDLLQDKDFKDKLDSASAFNSKYRSGSSEENGKTLKNKGGVGVDKILILDPFYFKTDERTKGSFKYYDSEEKLVKYAEILKENAAIANLGIEYLDSHDLKENDINKYNDYTRINDWMWEFLDHGYNRNMLNFSYPEAKKVIDKYDTRFVLWTGVYNHRDKKHIGGAVALTILSFGFLAPFTVPYMLRKEEQTMYFAVLFDMKENEILYTNTAILRLKDSPDFLNAFVYNTMLTIKTQPKFK